MKPIQKTRLFTPGPTPVLPEAALEFLLRPMHHRKEDFKATFREVQAGLRRLLKTRNEILLLSASGSGAMEAAMTNLLAPGGRALLCVAGKFGERWRELAEKFEIGARILEVPYGESIEAAQVQSCLEEDPSIAAVFIQATETSTGARMDLESIGPVVRSRTDTVLVVDAITGLGTMPLETDLWGLDVVIGGSQKAFMVPPGVTMLSISEKAWSRIKACNRPRYYFDLNREREGQREGLSGFTPSISVIQGMKAALDFMLRDGEDALLLNASLLAGATRAAVRGWNMRVFPRLPGNAVTAFVPPEGVEPSRVIALMRDRFGVTLSGGQGRVKGKILRIGHLGYFDFLETLGMIGCLEICLMDAGATIEPGAGPRAALQYYREAMRST